MLGTLPASLQNERSSGQIVFRFFIFYFEILELQRSFFSHSLKIEDAKYQE